jgi:TusA-related sulfurtransferase
VAHTHPRGIDLTGMDGAFALLKVSQIFRKMRAGEVLEIRGCAPDLRSDLLRVLPASACRILPGKSEAPPGRLHLMKTHNLQSTERTVP